jgi:hypothetical protein
VGDVLTVENRFVKGGFNMGTYDIVGATDDEAARAYDRVSGEGGGDPERQRINASSLPIHYAGAGPVTIPGSGSATFTFNLNMALRPDSLVIPEVVAPQVLVASINIGAISLNASADPAPGDMFRHDSKFRLRGAVSGSPSVPIKCTLLNATSSAISGVYLGCGGPAKRVN